MQGQELQPETKLYIESDLSSEEGKKKMTEYTAKAWN